MPLKELGTNWSWHKEFSPLTSGPSCYWLYEKRQFRRERRIYPWLKSVVSNSPDLCQRCKHLDFNFLYSPNLKDFLFKVKDGRDLPLRGIAIGNLPDLRERAARGCTLCRLLLQQLPMLLIDRHSTKVTKVVRNRWFFDQSQKYSCYLVPVIVEGCAVAHNHLEHGHSRWTELAVSVAGNQHQGIEVLNNNQSAQNLALLSLTDKQSSARKLSPRISFDLATSWLQSCKNFHGGHENSECVSRFPKANNPDATTFFINVRHLQLSEERIYDTEYAALSYVWGPCVNVRATTENITGYQTKAGLQADFARLPRTVKDAIKVCSELKIDFLWVDALCIVQNADDKHDQLKLMDVIYSSSILTIVAAVGDHANVGLMGVSDLTRQSTQSCVTLDEETQLALTMPDPEEEVQNSTWNSRCWTLQERLLSQRLLIFGPDQLQFHCRHGRCVESETRDPHCKGSGAICSPTASRHQPDATPIKPFTNPRNESHISERFAKSVYHGLTTSGIQGFETYADLVQQYSKRQLSYQTDALNAFEGLLSALTHADSNSSHAWGLPVNILDQALLWRTAEPLPRRTSRTVEFPSWSWTSRIGPISYQYTSRETDCTRPVYCGEEFACLPWAEFRHEHEKSMNAGTSPRSRYPCPAHIRVAPSIVIKTKPRLVLQADVAFLYVAWNDTFPRRYREEHPSRQILNHDNIQIGQAVFDQPESAHTFSSYRFVAINRVYLHAARKKDNWRFRGYSRSFEGCIGDSAIQQQISKDALRQDYRSDKAFSFQNEYWPLYNVLVTDQWNGKRLGVGEINMHAFDAVSQKGAIIELR